MTSYVIIYESFGGGAEIEKRNRGIEFMLGSVSPDELKKFNTQRHATNFKGDELHDYST
jgi:hypothetical protein